MSLNPPLNIFMPDIVDVLKQLQAAGLGQKKSLTQPQQVPGQELRRDAATGELMEVRDIYSQGNHVATLDYNKSTGAWFLDTQELVKLSRVPNVVDLILAEERK